MIRIFSVLFHFGISTAAANFTARRQSAEDNEFAIVPDGFRARAPNAPIAGPGCREAANGQMPKFGTKSRHLPSFSW
jgi:hypothetical protein